MSVLSDMQKVIDKIIDHIDKTLTKGSVTNTQVASVLHFLNDAQKNLWNKIKKVSESSLSKKQADTAEEPITFAKGLTTLNAIIQDLAEAKNLSVSEVAEIAKLVISGEIKSKDYSDNDGFKIFRGENGWSIEIDNIVARKTFKTLEIVVQRVIHQGGQIIQSPAGGELVKFYSESPFVWAFYVNTSDDFFNGDLILCQTFIGNKVKRYWRRVDGYNSREKIIFIRKDDCEAGSAPCEVGDIIVVFGNKSALSRQNACIINIVGTNAPYTAYYAGINNYTLRGKLITQIGNLAGVYDPAFGGQLNGVGLYTRNLYAVGENIVLRNGKNVEQALSPDSIVSIVKPILDSRLGGEVINKQVDLTHLDENKFYPLMLWLEGQKRARITVHRPLDWLLNRGPEMYQMSYAKHPNSGFMTLLEWEVTGSGWGASPVDRVIKTYSKDWLKENEWAVGDIDQIYQLTCEMVYLRGGTKYNVQLVSCQNSWVRQFFPPTAEPIQLYERGFSYEQDIKNNPAYGETEEEREKFFGRVNFPVKSTVVEPKVTSEAKLQELESKIIQKNDEIKLQIKGLQIGARNLVNKNIYDAEEEGCKHTKGKVLQSHALNRVTLNDSPIKESGYYAVSFYFRKKTSGFGDIIVDINDCSFELLEGVLSSTDDLWHFIRGRVYVDHYVNTYGFIDFYTEFEGIVISDLTVVKGGIPLSEWVSSPEDVMEDIRSEIKIDDNGISLFGKDLDFAGTATFRTLFGNKTKEQLADELGGQTVIDGGKINSNLVEVNKVKVLKDGETVVDIDGAKQMVDIKGVLRPTLLYEKFYSLNSHARGKVYGSDKFTMINPYTMGNKIITQEEDRGIILPKASDFQGLIITIFSKPNRRPNKQTTVVSWRYDSIAGISRFTQQDFAGQSINTMTNYVMLRHGIYHFRAWENTWYMSVEADNESEDMPNNRTGGTVPFCVPTRDSNWRNLTLNGAFNHMYGEVEQSIQEQNNQ